MGRIQMGPAGAALGTTLAQTVSVVVALFYMKGRKTGISLKRQDFVPRRKVMGELLKVGVPVAVQDGVFGGFYCDHGDRQSQRAG